MGFSGKWKGFYIYLGDYHSGYFGERVDFVLDIQDDNGSIKGKCNELKNEFSVDEESIIKGFANGEVVSFELIYPSLIYVDDSGKTIVDPENKMKVLYQGEYDEGADVFCGTWHIDERYDIGEEEQLYMEGDGIWKMKREQEVKSDFDSIYEFLEEKLTNDRAIKDKVLFQIEGNHIHINGNGSANSLSKTNQESNCEIIITEAIFMDMINGKIPANFIMNPHIKIKGNIGTAIKVQTILAS